MGFGITCDVLIVGAGPAGVAAAYKLARNGIDVVLFDRRRFPRPKLCAGLLTKKTIRLVEDIFGPCLTALKSEDAVYHTLRKYRIYSGTANVIAQGHLDFPFHLVDRPRYDAYLLQKARKAGARIHTGVAIDNVCPETGAAMAEDGTPIRSRIVVAADGVHSRIRSGLFSADKLKQRWWPQLAQTLEVKIPIDQLPKQTPYASLHFGGVPWGYAWSFPAGQWHILGICRLPSKDGPPLKKSFGQFVRRLGLSLDQMGPLGSHPLPYGNYLDTPTKSRVLLIGDACGLADPLLGEGIFYAHKSGRLAAQAIIEKRMDKVLTGQAYHYLLRRDIYNEFRWIRIFRNLMFMGGRQRKFRSLQILFRLKQRQIEAALQGDTSFKRLLWL